jgi:hypothetical protein
MVWSICEFSGELESVDGACAHAIDRYALHRDRNYVTSPRAETLTRSEHCRRTGIIPIRETFHHSTD